MLLVWKVPGKRIVTVGLALLEISETWTIIEKVRFLTWLTAMGLRPHNDSRSSNVPRIFPPFRFLPRT